MSAKKTTIQVKNMEDHYLVLSSTDSTTLFSDNTGNDFTVYLPQPLILKGIWQVAVTQVSLETDNPSFPGVMLCCDLCENSIVGSEQHPILRHLTFLKRRTSWEFYNLQYRKVKKEQVNAVRILIKAKAEASHVTITSLLCTLHLKRVG
jgi:hypothetical protein